MRSRARFPRTQPQADGDPRIDRAGAGPGAGEVVSEIGLILAIHLAVALAIGLTLRALGIG